MFEFMIKQTHEPELRFDKAVKFLSSEYYNTPDNFEGSLLQLLIKILLLLKNL